MEKIYLEVWLSCEDAEKAVKELERLAERFLRRHKGYMDRGGYHVVFRQTGKEVRFYGDKFVPETDEEREQRHRKEEEEWIEEETRRRDEEEKEWLRAEEERYRHMAEYEEIYTDIYREE